MDKGYYGMTLKGSGELAFGYWNGKAFNFTSEGGSFVYDLEAFENVAFDLDAYVKQKELQHASETEMLECEIYFNATFIRNVKYSHIEESESYIKLLTKENICVAIIPSNHLIIF